MTEAELLAVEERAKAAGRLGYSSTSNRYAIMDAMLVSADDVPALVAEVRRLQEKHERLRQGLLRQKELGQEGVLFRKNWDTDDFRESWLADRRKDLAAFLRVEAEKIADLAEFTTEEDADEVRMHWRLAVGPPVGEKPEQPVVFAIRRKP